MDKKIIYMIGGVAGLIILGVLALALTSKKAGTPSAEAFPTGPVTLTFWDPFNTSQNITPLIADYEKLHPNVHIIYTQEDGSNINNYPTDLLQALAAGTGPDIFAINNSWLPEYLSEATAAPASIIDYTDFKNTFVTVATQDFTKNQQVYGVPLSVDSLGLYYNKDCWVRPVLPPRRKPGTSCPPTCKKSASRTAPVILPAAVWPWELTLTLTAPWIFCTCLCCRKVPCHILPTARRRNLTRPSTKMALP